MQTYPAFLGQPGKPGYRVVVQARLRMPLAMVRGMSGEQKEELLFDWQAGREVLLAIPGVVDWRQRWIWSKLGLVLLLTVFHFALAVWRHVFAAGRIPHSARFFRMVNELPTLAMIAIVIFVVVKPF